MLWCYNYICLTHYLIREVSVDITDEGPSVTIALRPCFKKRCYYGLSPLAEYPKP